ncbi:hypothetical protein QTP88_004606 [Uroleucon formosanum]
MSEAKKTIQCGLYIKYGFIQSRTNLSSPMCLICQKTFSNETMKPSRLLDNFNKMNSAQPTLSMLFSAASEQDNDGLRASYNISLLTAKTGKPHTIGEDLILPTIKEVITTVLHKLAADIIRKIPLSNSSVQRRIYEMAENIEESLCNHLKTSIFNSMG